MQADPLCHEDLAGDRHGLPPFFIVGVDRSGTTLLRSMLNRHRDFAIPPESHFVPRLWKRRRRYGRKGRIEHTEKFLLDLAAEMGFRSWEVTLEAVRRNLIDMPTFGDAIATAYRAYAADRGKTRWGDKTPGYGESIPLLGRLLPQARFIHVIRDGRDVALSMLDRERVSKYRTKTPLHRHAASPAFFWARRIRIIRRAAEGLGADRYCEIRYEDLIDDPEGQLRCLCQFLGAEFDPGMLVRDGSELEGVPNSQRWLHTRLALPLTKGLRDWRRQMPTREVAEFEAVAGRELSKLGYPLVAGTPSPAVRLLAWGQVTWFVVRTFRIRMTRRLRRQLRRRALRSRPHAA